MDLDTVVIKIRDGDPLCVSVKRLTADSRVFRYFIHELRYDELEMDDFSPDVVALFLAVLEDRSLSVSDIHEVHFRELHKMSLVFEVQWLTETCSEWLTGRIEEVTGETDVQFKLFLFEECLYILRKWESNKFMDLLFSMMINLDNTEFISKYMQDFEKLDETQLNFMLILGGSNAKAFLELLIQNIDTLHRLDKNTKYLLQNMNLRLCLQVNAELYHELFQKISVAENIESEDLVWAFKLSAAAAMQAVKRRKAMETSENIVFCRDNISKMYYCTLQDIADNVENGRITSMFAVVELIVNAFYKSPPTSEEIEEFRAKMNEFAGSDKPLKRVSKQFVDLCISALKSSHPSVQEDANAAIKILNEINDGKELSSHQENVHLSANWYAKKESVWCKNVFRFCHPESLECQKGGECGFILKYNLLDQVLELCKDATEYEGSGVHYHDEIQADDIYYYVIWSARLNNGTTVKVPSRRWFRWFLELKSWKVKEYCVDYNIRNHLLLASQCRVCP